MLGSLGLAFALLGTVLMFASGQGSLGEGMERPVDAFHASGAGAPSFTLRLGVVFALIGYGTKAGLAPMHTWKPDAYREAPSPAVVLMAVGMLNGALYVLRIHLISTASLGPEFSEGLLLTLGLLSVLIATPFVLIQWNVKRLLVLQHRARRDHGHRDGTRRASGGVRGAVAHDLSLAGETRGALFCRHAAQLHSSSNFDRIGQGTSHARRPRALLVLATVIITGSPPWSVLQRDDDSQSRIFWGAPDGDGRVPRRVNRAVLWVRVSGGTPRARTTARSRRQAKAAT